MIVNTPAPIERRQGTLGAVAVAVLAFAVAAAVASAGAARHVSHAAAQERNDLEVRVLLPLVLRSADRGDLNPPTVPRPTEEASATPTQPPSATPTFTPTVTPTPLPLVDRIVQREVPIEGSITRGMGTWTSYPIVTALRYDGSRLVGWSATTGTVHITPLDREGVREAPDIVFDGQSVHGLVAHAGGGAALYVNGDEMRLRRFEDDGTVVFENALVGTESHGGDGAKWIDDWSHEGRLSWTGEMYAAYFGHTQNWGSRGNHQGDLLWIFDEDGVRVTGADIPMQYPSWDWGCSHSVDLRLEHNSSSDVLAPICLSDEFPRDGVIYARSNLIAEMPGDGGGHVEGELGGLVKTGDGFTATYVSRTGRSSYDVGLAYISEFGFPTFDTWLTDTRSVNETSAHLARYGDDLLAAWVSGGELLLSVLDIDGNTMEGPIAVDADIGPRDDFVSFDDGRAGWTYAGPSRRSLVSVEVQHP